MIVRALVNGNVVDMDETVAAHLIAAGIYEVVDGAGDTARPGEALEVASEPPVLPAPEPNKRRPAPRFDK